LAGSIIRRVGDMPTDIETGVTWKRLSVNVASDVADAINTLQNKHGWTISDVIRRAVTAYKFIDDETQNNGKILIERNGTIREVHFVY
jgi:hypothetical protein